MSNALVPDRTVAAHSPASRSADADLSSPQWHSLSKEEQAKYYEMARKERLVHSKLYPGWSARDNYVSASASFGAAPLEKRIHQWEADRVLGLCFVAG